LYSGNVPNLYPAELPTILTEAFMVFLSLSKRMPVFCVEVCYGRVYPSTIHDCLSISFDSK
jgi:hypothetical protein